jgi:hypothetical protein
MSNFQLHLQHSVKDLSDTFDLILDILDLLPFNVADLDWLQRLLASLTSIYMSSRHITDSSLQSYTLDELNEIGNLANSILSDYLSLSLDGGGSIRLL